jgi:hypothetical protein
MRKGKHTKKKGKKSNEKTMKPQPSGFEKPSVEKSYERMDAQVAFYVRNQREQNFNQNGRKMDRVPDIDGGIKADT